MPRKCICEYQSYVRFFPTFPTQLKKNAGDPFVCHCFTVSECQQSWIILGTLTHSWTSGNSAPGMIWGPYKTYFTACKIALRKGLPAVASPPRSGPHDSPLLQQPPRQPAPIVGAYLLRLQGEEAQLRIQPLLGPPLLQQKHLLKQRGKRQRKKKRTIPKCTVTSETIPPVEKKPKVFSESPDSEAEGPFRDSDRTVSAPEGSPDTL